MAAITQEKIGSPEITVEIWEPDQKQFNTPLLFVHGCFGGTWMWEKLLNFFSSKGFSCYAPTLRGHGPRATLDLVQVHMGDYVQDALQAAKLAQGTPIVIGHSLGGLVALRYAVRHAAKAVIAIDPSPPQEAASIQMSQKEIEAIPEVYGPKQAGMPQGAQIRQALPDMPKELLEKLPQVLGPESGTARRERKAGISVPADKIKAPLLFVAAQKGNSLPFGIGQAQTKKSAEVYDADFEVIKSATHPGIIMGNHWPETARTIYNWLISLNIS